MLRKRKLSESSASGLSEWLHNSAKRPLAQLSSTDIVVAIDATEDSSDSTSAIAEFPSAQPKIPYFLRSFQMISEAIQRNSLHLFDGAEIALLQKFDQLSLDAKCLFVRLFNRKGPWFALNSLVYPYMSIKAATKELRENGFLSDVSRLRSTKTLSAFTGRDQRQGIARFFSVASASAPPAPVKQSPVRMSSRPFTLPTVIVLDDLSDSDDSAEQFSTRSRNNLPIAISDDDDEQPSIPEPNKTSDVKTSSSTSGGANIAIGEDVNDDIVSYLQTFTVAQLREICTRSGLKGGPTREQFVQVLRDRIGNNPSRLDMVIKVATTVAGECVALAPTIQELFARIQRMFRLEEFRVVGANEWQQPDTSMIVLADLSRLQFAPYQVRIERPIWKSREELLAYEDALKFGAKFEAALRRDDDGAHALALLSKATEHLRVLSASCTDLSQIPVFLRCFTPNHVYARIVSFGVSLFERARDYDSANLALQLLLKQQYLPHKHGHWYDRMSVNLVHLKRKDEARELCAAALTDTLVRGGSLVTIKNRLERLNGVRKQKEKKQREKAKAPPSDDEDDDSVPELPETVLEGMLLRKKTAQKSIFEGCSGYCGVEELSLQYYAHAGGWKGAHCETGMLCMLFGLLMWDVIFADIPDVFHTAYQSCPLDLETDGFYQSRSVLIEERVAQLRDCADVGALVLEAYAHEGMLCRGVAWSNWTKDDLVCIARGLGSRGVAAICYQLARDFKHWARGGPDLVLWKDGACKLAEVKGPRDRLSGIQRAWLSLLLANGVDVELCRVRECEGRPEWLAAAVRARRESEAANSLDKMDVSV
eukprot:TRINITY_DN6655_c0_g1_i1.p1 TRINITY_DN6655_c0_g1~~TRINITY_DN6655_c0_g1_i1.p1  ORF type:complete len:821 (-),score=143.87 TRINITY_DN6655_c0_g1_i1:506-2968(-)